MEYDVVGLRDFYHRPLGGIVRRLLTQRIRTRWRSARGRQLAGLGFAVPYIGMFREEASQLCALMPASQGAVVWPQSGNVLSVLVDEVTLPLPDSSIDLLLCVHCLEVAESTRPMLREMWRVLAPEGRMLLIVPNRRGLWARFDTTPFGHGRPYSRGQLERLLAGSLFTPLEWSSALYMPPLGYRVRAHGCQVVARLRRRHHRRGAQGTDGRHPQGGRRGQAPAGAGDELVPLPAVTLSCNREWGIGRPTF
jgi:SAM-dependent methyltransferase